MSRLLNYLALLLLNLIIAHVAVVNFRIDPIHYFIIGSALIISKYICLEI